MRKNILLILFITAAAAIPAFAQGQTAASLKPSVVTGDVASISDAKIVLTTKDGSLDVTLSDKTVYKRVRPEDPAVKSAVTAVHSDIGVGDKLMVTGIFSDDKKVLPARSVYLMTKSDIAQKNQNESEKWKTRGVSGKVTAVDPQTNQITVEVRGLANTSTVVLTPKADAKFLRYAPNSVKFSEAVASSFSDLKAGDMIRALGDKSADGAAFAAEEIVSGAFQTIAGTVKSVDAAKNEVVITNAQTKKDVTIDLSLASVIKKFPEEMATRMAQLQGGGARPAQNGAPAAGSAPAGGGQGRGGGRSGGIDEMLDRFPNITAADLKAGDVIAVSSTKTQNPDRVMAIKMLAGVEPFLKIAQAANSGGQRGGRGSQTDGGFTIPGLDGFG
ncbi:MAG TPA: hypothetical protein VK468_11365, partial [Pyrinomonadaceae bacterium]|nr:hypothetical protein [Pyrinomonadaceae bacterium]